MASAPLTQKINQAYFWTTAGNLAKNAIGFGISVMLGRLLDPKDFGLLAYATVFTNILAMLQDCGVGQAVVYFQEERKGLPLYYTMAAGIGTVLTAFAFFAAPAVGAFYGNPAITPIVRALSPVLFFGSVSSVAQGSLSRDFSFRSLSLIELAGTALGGITGIVCALLGYGVWALVANVLISLSMQAGGLCYLVRPHFDLRPDFTKMKRLLRWGLPFTGAGLLWQAYENSDYMVIGKLSTEAALGQYRQAFGLATLVNSRIASVINRVSFPAFSAVQTDALKLVAHWYTLTQKLALLTFPISAAVAFNAHDFLLVVMLPKWLPAEVPLQLLCIIGAMKPLVATMNNCLAAIGRTDITFRFCLTNALLLPGSFYIACRLAGISGVAAAWCIVSPLVFVWFLVRTMRLVQGSLWQYAVCLRPGLLIAAASVAAMFLVGIPVGEGVVRLVVRTIVGGLVILGGYCLHPETRAMVAAYWPLGRKA